MVMLRRGLLLTILLFTLFPSFAEYSDFYYGWATFFYPNSDDNSGLTLFPSLFIPMGGKYEGMGTAYTAVANDISFIESNPAASSLLPKTELAFLHHSWIMDSNIEGVVYATRLENLGLAGGVKFLYVPFNEKDDWGRAGGRGYYLEGIATANVSYNFLRSYYFGGIAVGANVKLAYMGVPDSIYPNQSFITGLIDVGVLTRFNLLKFYSSSEPNFAVGAAFKNYSPLPSSDPLPTFASFGIAYSPLRPLLVAFDFNLPLSFDPALPAERFYFAAGLSVTFSPFLALQTGVKWKGANPMVSLGAAIDTGSVTFNVNYSLDLSSTMDPLDKFSLSAKFNLGDAGRLKKEDLVERLYLEGMILYGKGRLAEAIAKWKEVLALDPEHTPTRNFLKITEDELELKTKLQNLPDF